MFPNVTEYWINKRPKQTLLVFCPSACRLNNVCVCHKYVRLICLYLLTLTINSLTPGRYGSDSKSAILYNRSLGTPCENPYQWMLQNLTKEKSTLVQVMAWCRQATSHYLSQCWPKSMWPYCVTTPQWVNVFVPDHSKHKRFILVMPSFI